MTNILQINRINKRFPAFHLQDVSFSIPQGYILGLIGPNGAGKTTTIKAVLNMLTLDGGKIQVFGQDHIADEQKIKERIGVVLDQPYYVELWTVGEVEKACAPFYSNWDGQKYDQLLRRFQLERRKKVKDLSRGMKMKLMIAVALSHDAQLLILDEPTSGLDPVSRDELLDILGEFITDERHGVLFSTHITTDLEKIADYITFMKDGQVHFSGTKDELMERYVMVKGDPAVLTTGQRDCILGYRKHTTGFEGLAAVEDVPRLPRDILVEKATMDEIMVHIYKEGVKS